MLFLYHKLRDGRRITRNTLNNWPEGLSFVSEETLAGWVKTGIYHRLWLSLWQWLQHHKFGSDVGLICFNQRTPTKENFAKQLYLSLKYKGLVNAMNYLKDHVVIQRLGSKEFFLLQD